MAELHETGKRGEKMAIDLLKSKGYQILETNWRFSRAEIDIIAKIDEVLIFVEVKTRSSVYFGQPEEFIDHKKEKLVADAASEYMKQVGHEWECRFDFIAIILTGPSYQIKHIEDAFFPGLE